MTTTTTDSKFIADLKASIIDRLNDYQDTSEYGCDLAFKLFEGENANGTVLFSTAQTQDFIKENFELFGDLVNHVSFTMDMHLNPFLEPEKAHVVLLLEAAQSVLSKLPTIDANWNNSIKLTAPMIKKLTKEILSLEIQECELF